MADESEKLNQRLARDLQEALGACGVLGGSLGYPDRHADLMRFEAKDVAARLEKVAARIRQDVAEDEAREASESTSRNDDEHRIEAGTVEGRTDA